MDCECGGRLIWRCDNYEKDITKYACNKCKKIISKPLKKNPPKEPLLNKLVEKENWFGKSKYYYYNKTSKRWTVERIINGKRRYFGTMISEDRAKYVVEQLNKCNWDMKQVPRINAEMHHKFDKKG